MAYQAYGSAIYNGSTLSLMAWLLKDGVRLTTAVTATAELRQASGTLISTFTPVSAPNSYGVFAFTAVSVSLSTNTQYTITLGITDETAVVRSTIVPVLNFN